MSYARRAREKKSSSAISKTEVRAQFEREREREREREKEKERNSNHLTSHTNNRHAERKRKRETSNHTFAAAFQHDQTSNLRHRFYHQNSRHDWPLRKMPGKKVVVDGDIFHANSVRALFDFEDAIDE